MLIKNVAAAIVCLSIMMSSTMAPPIPFDDVKLYLEFNSTDGDGELVVIVNNDVAFKTLYVYAPSGRRIFNFKATDSQHLGVREFLAESAEPSLNLVFESFPEGRYRVTGRTIDGDTLRTDIDLSHDLPPAPIITSPLAGATDVPVNGTLANWNNIPGAAGYLVELEQELEDSEETLTATRPAGASSFRFPNNWLEPDTETQFGVAVIGANGNVTVTEVQFTTAP